MRVFLVSLVIFLFLACDKVIDVQLPAYEPQLVMEMYLEEGKPLRCLLMESLPYTDTAITKMVNDALVIFSDGTTRDTLFKRNNQDPITGRLYNYYHPRLVKADPTKIYTLLITGNNKKISAKTSFSQKITLIDSINIRQSIIAIDSFSVGLVISDPVEIDNYYRFLIGKELNHFASSPTDFRVSDISFNGKRFSFFSEADFARNDTVLARIYSLQKDHFEYLESIGDARRSNSNPFSQPGRIKTNITGGLGIFTTTRYTEKKIVIK